MNEVLAKGRRRKRSLELVLKSTEQKRSTFAIADQLILETAYI